MSDSDPEGRSPTHFAPGERSARDELEAAAALAAADPLAAKLLEAVDGCAVILNRQRQIIAANRQFLEVVGAEELADVLGQRPGEALHCDFVEDGPSGCGTAHACESCGAVLAVLAALHDGRSAVRECLLTTTAGGGLQAGEFRVRTTAMALNGEDFVVAVMQDISAEKRREALERVFFHDVLNTINALSGWVGLMAKLDDDAAVNAMHQIDALSRRLTRLVQDQRVLHKAEHGSLELSLDRTLPSWVLKRARDTLLELTGADENRVRVVPPETDGVFQTDPTVLVRVLVLMLKNALEAGRRADPVEMRCQVEDDAVVFSVWNTGHMAPEVSRQVFKRSFTTKAESGRGLGTYTMKLFGERLLGGTVTFTSSPDEGTRFSIRLPRSSDTSD